MNTVYFVDYLCCFSTHHIYYTASRGYGEVINTKSSPIHFILCSNKAMGLDYVSLICDVHL